MAPHELLFERSGFKVTAPHGYHGLLFQTVGTVGVSGEDLDAFIAAINAWYATPRLITL